MSKHEFTVVVIPHSGGKTIERRFSVLGFRVLVVLANVLLLAATVTVALAVRVHISNADYLSLKARNADLQTKLGKLNRLADELDRMKQEDARIRTMLGIDQQPPKLDLDRLYEVLAQDSGAFLDSAAIRMLDTLSRVPLARANPGVPGIPPVNGFTISRGYSRSHPGIDLVAESGTPVMATASGVVVFAGWDTVYGNAVQIQHDDGFRTLYGHLLRIARLVGDSVNQGDLIGLVGSTGRSTAPHLHYEITKAGKQVAPQQYFQ
jgi:murein DD-endopeptidase MepM/ murein hydrolase activator NlpD